MAKQMRKNVISVTGRGVNRGASGIDWDRKIRYDIHKIFDIQIFKL